MIATVLRAQRHSNGSGSILARALGCGHSGPDHPRNCRTTRYVINWGVNTPPSRWQQRRLIWSNTPDAVEACRDKILTFQRLNTSEVPCLEHTSNQQTAAGWKNTDGKVVVRATTTGHSGAGISVVREGELPRAPLYTRYFKKNSEYRVHVFYGQVILIQQKRKDREHQFQENQNLIRTHDNGWVFCVNDLSCDAGNYRQNISDLAIRAANAVGANHCAVDLLVQYDRNARFSKAVVCEINSAPALRCTASLTAYRNAFQTKLASGDL